MALTDPARSVPEAQIFGIAARDPKRAQRLAKKYHIPRLHETYAALLSDPDIDAVYNRRGLQPAAEQPARRMDDPRLESG
jgi:hypothetical protein